MTIVDALNDAAVFGRHFGAEWDRWRAFCRAVFGLGMSAADLDVYRECTGRQDAPIRQAREAWCIAGRRAGKSRIAAVIAVYLAAFRDYRDVLAVGEVGTLPVVASDRRQARTVMQYIAGLIDETPMLARLVVHRSAESIELSTGCRIEIHTASWRALRGYSVVGGVLDEICFWRSEDSVNPDTEIVNALRPAMATVPISLLVAISSPYARRGVAWEMHRRHHGPQGDPGILTWRAASRLMNPSIPEAIVIEALDQDEPAARSEWLAEWRRDIEAFLSREVLDAAVMPGVQGLPPVRDRSYVAFVDPSGGSSDAFTLAIAHAERNGDQVLAVLDHVSARRPPFSPAQTVEEFSATLRAYRVDQVIGDRYGGEFPREQFRKHGVVYECSALVKSDIYREALPLLTSGRVRLLDDPGLHRELLGLERRTARGGRDSIDHGPHGHDDVANAACGALVLAAARAGSGDFMLAANLAPEPRGRLLDEHEFALLGRF